jgi:hypothetical protein
MEFRLPCFNRLSFLQSPSSKCLHRKAYPRCLRVFSQLTLDPFAQHPSPKADALYFLDTLEHLIPILPPPIIHSILPIIGQYLQPQSTPRSHLESAHSVFLAILARGDILHDQILPYIDQVYTVPLLPYIC